jgi:hypothetical protein
MDRTLVPVLRTLIACLNAKETAIDRFEFSNRTCYRIQVLAMPVITPAVIGLGAGRKINSKGASLSLVQAATATAPTTGN